MKRKGQVSFGDAPAFVIALVLMGMIAAAGVISLVSFRASSVDATANASITNAITGVSNFTGQLPVVGTMVGVGLIIVVVLGVFASKRGNL